jgi:hypothetical protein
MLGRLLAGKPDPSVVDKEGMLANVLERSVPAPARRLRFGLAWSAALALAAGVLVIVYSARREPEWVPRGGAAPAFEVSCGGPCRSGSHLLFNVTPGSARYLSALAVAADQRVLWYFDARELTGPGVLSEAPVIGPEHGTGTFDVFAVFSATPLTRVQVREQVERAGPSVLKQRLVVEP